MIGHFLEMDRKDRLRYPELYAVKGRSSNSSANPWPTGTSAAWSSQSQVKFSQPLPPIKVMTDTISTETANIKDYMCWSFVNVFLGGLFLGFISLLLSSAVRNHKIEGRVADAQSMSTITALWNGFLTLVGISGIIALIFYASGYL